MPQTSTAIAVIGIDIGKNSFHVVGHDARGAIVLRQKWSRGQVEGRLANLPPCLIGMEILRRRTSPEPQPSIAWSRCQVDAGQICPPYSKGQIVLGEAHLCRTLKAYASH
jgi:transposase